MLLAIGTSLLLLALAGCCAHRLWFGTRLWQALVFLPPMLAAWAASLFLRTPTEMGALVTFLSGDLALYGLAILGVMRMLGGLPMESGSDGGDDGGGGDDPPDPVDPVRPSGPARREHAHRRPGIGPRPQRPRPPRHVTTRSRPTRDAPRVNRGPATWWSDRTD